VTPSSGDTAWVLTSAALVLLMTPGLALFYGGMVRAKSVLNMMMMSFGALGLISVLWVLYGYSLSFGDDAGGGLVGNFDFVGLKGLMSAAPLGGVAGESAGIPPLAGFFAKYYVFLGAIKAGLYGLAVIGVLASVVGAYYYLLIVKIMYFDEPAEGFVPVPGTLKAVLGVAGLFNLLYFLYPAPLIAAAALAASGTASTTAPTIPDCFAQVVAPKAMVLACADGNLTLEDLSWTNWGAASATATLRTTWAACFSGSAFAICSSL